jgi:two-component system, chemotaxis family, sensor kinase CheA
MLRPDELKNAFFEQSRAHLEAVEIGLSDLREGGDSEGTIRSVLRAGHWINRGAGVFGFERLAAFADMFETVVEAIKRADITATPDVVDVLLSANDILTDLVESAHAQVELPAGYERDSRTALARLMRTCTMGSDKAASHVAVGRFDQRH